MHIPRFKIAHFDLVFFCFFVFLVLGGERHKMGIKRLIYSSFLTEVDNKD